MELELIRTYRTNGCNGKLYTNGSLLCYTIELPWRNNQPQISCIPEGRYELIKRYSLRLGHHLQIEQVPGRDLILIHSANDALKELKGCIAPVSSLTGEGKGVASRAALEKLIALVYATLENETVFITIKSMNNDTYKKNTIAHSNIL